jgi:hypothetical protein
MAARYAVLAALFGLVLPGLLLAAPAGQPVARKSPARVPAAVAPVAAPVAGVSAGVSVVSPVGAAGVLPYVVPVAGPAPALPVAEGGRLSPNTELQAALHHLSHVAPANRYGVRYLSMYNLPPEQWDGMTASVSVALNTLSRALSLRTPMVNRVHPSLLVVYWESWFQLPLRGWEAMASREPYWHLQTEVLDPKTKKKKLVVTDGGWVDLSAAASLRLATNSVGAVLRADYFLAKSMTTLDGGLYYELAGIPPKEDDFFKLVGINRAEVEKSVGLATIGANTYKSDVTRKPRRVVRWQGPLGPLWQTFDTDVASPDKDPFINPFEFVYAASEIIAAKPNGAHYFGLYNAKGELQKTVPDNIAKDHRDLVGSGILAPAVACMRCHDTGGWLSVRNDQKRLLAPPVELYLGKEEQADKLRAFYDSPKANVQLARDREDYELAYQSLVGVAAGQANIRLAGFFDTYLYGEVTAAVAAAEVGLAVEDFLERMKFAQSPTLLSLLKGIGVQRQQWDSAFQEAAILSHQAGHLRSAPK